MTFKYSDFITAKIYALLHSCSYSTAKKIYNVDRSILKIENRKIKVREYCRLYGLELSEFNEEYKQA